MNARAQHIATEAWPAGLRREMAAAYIGISPSKFDDWVQRGIMPRPKRQDGIVVWIRWSLDLALDALPDHDPDAKMPENPFRDLAT